MSLRLYNTRTRTVEPFAPLRDGNVGMYVCGLTPSAEAHLGHARSFLFFDVLRRYLEHLGYRAHVRAQRNRHRRSQHRARRRNGRVVVGDHRPPFRFVQSVDAALGCARTGRRAARDAIHRADRRDDRRTDRRRIRLHDRRRRLLRSQQIPALWCAIASQRRRTAFRRAHRRRRAQARRARLCAVEVRQTG